MDTPRLYLGRLPPDVHADDILKFFDGYGRIVDCRIMKGGGFGFAQFEKIKDAEDALALNGKPFMGVSIVVEPAKETRHRRNDDVDRPRARRTAGFRVIVSGLSRDTSWQDLKDFGREAGSVSFADIDRDNLGRGVLEYTTREDAERAVQELDGRDLRGQPVRVTLDADRNDSRREPREEREYGRDRYADRGYDRPRNGGRGEERRGGDVGRVEDRRDRDYRRDRSRDRSRSPHRRSRSPHRRSDDGRRPRSPPPKREYIERPAGDDRRRDDRYEDRPRHNGESGWPR